MTDNIKRLYRSRSDRMLAGVAAGLADYLDVDPTLIRLLFAFGVFLSGSGAFIYLVMALIIPLEPEMAAGEVVEAKPKPAPKRRTAKRTTTKKTTTKKSTS